MTNIANILALSKLTNETPDDVRNAATLMIVGGTKNPLISSIASANIVEAATASAVEATSAKAATVKVESEKAVVEAELATIRPLVQAVADLRFAGPIGDKAAGEEKDGYSRIVKALKEGETVEKIMAGTVGLGEPFEDPETILLGEAATKESKVITALAKAATEIKAAANGAVSEKQKQIIARATMEMLKLPAETLKEVKSPQELRDAVAASNS